MELQSEKRQLRRSMRAWRRGQDADHIRLHSQQICQQVRSLPAWQAAHTVCLFHAMPGEVQLAALWDGPEAGKRLCWPVVVGRGLPLQLRGAGPTARGPFGISEPTVACPELDLADVDLIIVPGLAFDRSGGRLGMGGGYYDRTLAHMRAVRLGVCFGAQLHDRVPRGAHDLGMHLVVTEGRVLRPGRDGRPD